MNITPSNRTNLYAYNKFFLSIKNMFDTNKLPNKIIFSGNKGIGKNTFVYHLINYIFSQNEDNKYNFNNNIISEENYSYNLIKKGTHPNFFLISNDNEKSNSQISRVREMIDFTNKSSFNDGYKIILIDNIELLNLNSINALLKIIEEPNDKIFFFLIHDSKSKIIDTLASRCIKFNFFLTNSEKNDVISKIFSDDFFSTLNNDFKNIYNSPGDIVSLYDCFKENDIDSNISIDDFLKTIIDKSLYKKDLYIKSKLSYFVELYFIKKIYFFNSNIDMYRSCKYFLSKLFNCNKYNLDIESVLIEFKGKILNG